jgi:hypothetical protein
MILHFTLKILLKGQILCYMFLLQFKKTSIEELQAPYVPTRTAHTHAKIDV